MTLSQALLEFDRSVACPSGSILIGSKLDAEAFSKQCRIAFHGRIKKAYESLSRY